MDEAFNSICISSAPGSCGSYGTMVAARPNAFKEINNLAGRANADAS